MPKVKQCLECGRVLPDTAVGGLCPACALRGALTSGGGEKAEDRDQRSEVGRQSPIGGPAIASEIAPRPSPLVTSSHFGDYELLEEIARGGMGVVWKARQKSLHRLVALKMMLSGQFAKPEFVQRFQAEAQAIAQLQHPNIVAIHEVGQHEGQPYFSMDYVQGRTLAEIVREGPLPAPRAATYLKAIAEGVHYAHQHDILHRDLKPSNVLIDASDQPRITDFGLAKRLTGDSELTVTGQVLGSPNYLSPEQAAGRQSEVGPESDVYALGAMLYHLVTGRPPFHADSLTTLLRQVIETEPVVPRLLNASVPRDLDTICLKCLEKEPSLRYGSAQAVADELSRFLEKKPILARPVGLVGKTSRWCRRKPALASAMGAVVLVGAVGFVGILSQWQRAEEQRQLAEQQRQRAEEQQRNAEASELVARQNAYASDMNLAQRELEANQVQLAVSLLDKYRPRGKAESRKEKAEIDLRGWEWRYLWQLCQADESVKLQTNPGPIGAMAISQDGRVMAAQTGENKIALWDLMAKRLVHELPASTSIKSLRLSSTGNLVAVSARNAHGEPTVEVWDVPAREVRATLQQPTPVRSLAFSPDETLLATFDDNGHIAVVEWAANRTLTNLVAARSPRHLEAGVVGFSPDGSRLAIGEDYGRIRILNWRRGTMVAITNLAEVGEGVAALAFSPSSELLATGFRSTVRLWDASSGEPREQWDNLAGAIRALAFSADGELLAAVSSDRTIRIWRVADQVELPCWRGHKGEGRALAFLPDGKTLVSGCDVGMACFWNVTATNRPSSHARLPISFGTGANIEVAPTNRTNEALNAKVVRRSGFAFTPDGRSFITTDPEGTLAVWDAGWPVQRTETLPMLGTNIWGVALSPDGRWLVAGDAAGQVTIWDWTARRRVTSSPLQFEWLGQLHFSRSGRFLWATSMRNQDWTMRFKIWRTADWQEVPLPGDHVAAVYSMDFSVDDRRLAVGFQDGTVRLWDFPTGRHATTFTNHTGPVTGLVFLPDGRRLASTSFDGTVKLQELFGKSEGAMVRRGAISALNLALSPDGRRLATGRSSLRDAIKLWDLATQREILSLLGEDHYVPIHIAFSPDGNTLVALSFAGIANLWHAPSWAEIAAAEKGAVTP